MGDVDTQSLIRALVQQDPRRIMAEFTAEPNVTREQN